MWRLRSKQAECQDAESDHRPSSSCRISSYPIRSSELIVADLVASHQIASR